MWGKRRDGSGPKRGADIMSIAVAEAFRFLNAGTRKHYRGWGDTATAARERAAREAGISPSQAERVWKRWKTMASVDGDVYRALRNAYAHLCEAIEDFAARMEREAGGEDATFQSSSPLDPGMVRAAQDKELK